MTSFSRKWALCLAALFLSVFVACSDDDDNFLKQDEDQEELSSEAEDESSSSFSSSSSSEKQKDGSSSSEKEDASSSSEEAESSSSTQGPKFVPGSFVDERDGHEYKTITINGYTWMAENLRYHTPNAVDTLNTLYYSDSEAVEACPRGWHVPNKEEWGDLLADVEKAYGKIGSYYLKSREGWEPYNDSIDGNGCDSLGFNVQPLGLVGESSGKLELRRVGGGAYFWTSTLADRKNGTEQRSPLVIEFENVQRSPYYQTTSNGVFFFSIRCLKNDNTMADSIGSCKDANVGEMFEFRDHFYMCDTSGWESAYMKEILEFEFGKCDSSVLRKVSWFHDTAYICRYKSMEWEKAEVEEALGKCKYKEENYGVLTVYQGVPYYCDSWWREATANEYLDQCDSTKISDFETYRDTLYVCNGKYWVVPTETQLALGTCDKKRKGESVAAGDSQFVCMDHYWRPFSIVESELGACSKDGAKGTYRGMEFVCDASRYLWKGTLHYDSKTYGVVAVDTLLWFTDNMTKTYWNYAVSDSANGEDVCPPGWIMPSKDEWENMIDYVSNYGGINAEFTIDSTTSIYGLNMVEEEDVEYWIPSQKYSCTESSMIGTICRADAAEVGNGSVSISTAWACSYSGTDFCSAAAVRCVLRP